MRNLFVKKLALAGMLCAVAVVGSLFSHCRNAPFNTSS